MIHYPLKYFVIFGIGRILLYLSYIYLHDKCAQMLHINVRYVTDICPERNQHAVQMDTGVVF